MKTKKWRYKKTEKPLTDIYKEEILDTRLVVSGLKQNEK